MTDDIEAKPWDRDVQDICDQLVIGTDFDRGVGYIGELADLVMVARSRLTEMEGALRGLMDEHEESCGDHHIHEGTLCPRWSAARAALSPKSEVATSGQNELNMTTSE